MDWQFWDSVRAKMRILIWPGTRAASGVPGGWNRDGLGLESQFAGF